ALALGPAPAGVADGPHGFHDPRACLRRAVGSASQHLGHGGHARTGGLGHQGRSGGGSGWSGGHGDRLSQRGEGPPGAQEAPWGGAGPAAGGPLGRRSPPAAARRARARHPVGTGTYSNQSKATVPSVAYMPMTRPVKPAATSVDR